MRSMIIRRSHLYISKTCWYALICGLFMTGCAGSRHTTSAYGAGWPAVHADSRNSDYSPVRGAKKLAFAWQRKFEGTINLGPTTGPDGKVYLTTSADGCHLYALNSETGQTVWCSDEVNKFAVASSALLDREGHIYLADDEAMHAFDRSGKLLWETPITGFPLSAQFTQTGRLIFITHIGLIYVLDKATGNPVMETVNLAPEHSLNKTFDPRACMRGTADCPCANTLAFDQQNGRFYFTYWKPGTAQAGLRAMQYTETNGPAVTLLWENLALPGGSASSPDISADGSRIYVNDNAGGLHAIDAVTGKNIWQFEIGYETGGSQSTSPEGLIMPAGGNGAALMCIRDEGDSARLLWRREDMHNRGVATQAAGGLSYVTVAAAAGKLNNDLAVVDVRTGKELDRKHLPGTTIFTVGTTIGPEGNVYVPTFNGLLFAYRPA
ncbi:PQQ-binding-like beta-propeller repeat protein [Chitinophaga sp. XS-30]|uniref:outer membrane protein assembly factor BamB family protein n=1 Tax=Chitinophaga sp. XS-30 TaxID=2604421 RepID=UPI0011DCB032|nr:PQQ-binding-like beta-propeller repeat protein [Chitinophaga sp. XS-30]QEH42502.1 PQQ-like beta-propeller repeat protein [Chitinophaga sp. XS-30]